MKSSSISREASRNIWFWAGLILLSGSRADAIDPHRAMSQYVRDTWGPEQGFPAGPVYAITQTADGYLWIGSEAGLIRFDGLNFQVLPHQSGASGLSDVLGVVPDVKGNIWVRLRDRTLLRYRDGHFSTPFAGAGNLSEVTAATRSNGGEFLAAQLQNGAFSPGEARFQRVAAASGMPRSPVIAIAQTGDGDVWLGTRGAGLFRLTNGKTIPVVKGLQDSKVNCLLPEGAKSLWVGTDSGVVFWNGKELTTAGVPAALSHFQALSMTKDRDGNLWIGTDTRGLLRFNAQGVSALDSGSAGELSAVTTVFEDREGNLWLGRASGIERLRDSAFVTYSGPEGLSTDGSNPVFVDSDERVWFAPVDGGLGWFQGKQHGAVTSDGLDKDIVYSIAGGGKNELWVGRQRGGLTHVRLNGGAAETRTYTHADGLAQDSVYSAYRASDGSIWAGTLSGGVSRLDHDKFTTYTTANGLASNTVASILETHDGVMWFTTPNGLSSFADRKWQTYTLKEGLPSGNVNCLLEDSDGTLWVGTTAGLAIRSGGRLLAPPGLAQNVPRQLQEQILGMAEDKYGALWISTSNHVLRVDRRRLLKGGLRDGDLRQYGLADGLRGLEGVKRHRSVVADGAGKIWFSLNKGISVVDPARLTKTSIQIDPQVRTVSTDGTAIELKNPVRIPSGKRRVVFGFAALSLSIPERIRYKYKLDGFDRAWSEPAEGREAVYTNLSPKQYRFRVLASNADGVWGPHESSLGFEVTPAFWQTWWFEAAAVVGCILAFIALYRLRLFQMTSRLTDRFEERLAERTRIAQELHDTLLQGFLSASMQVHVAAEQLPADSKTKPLLTHSLGLMRRVIEEGRNVVRGLRTTQSATLELEQAFSRVPAELSSSDQVSSQTDFRVIVDGKKRPLHPVLRDEVYRIGREALINAFRHARARRIEIELTYSSRKLRVVIRDDGCGIDPETLREGREGHWGLSGMRERAERIHARLQLFSAPTSGTEIELSVPAYIAFQDQPRSITRWFRPRHSEQPK